MCEDHLLPCCSLGRHCHQGLSHGHRARELGSREFNSEGPDQKNLLCHTRGFHGMTFKPHCWKIALAFQQALCTCPLRSHLLNSLAPQHFPGLHNSSSLTTAPRLQFSCCLRNLKHFHVSETQKGLWFCLVLFFSANKGWMALNNSNTLASWDLDDIGQDVQLGAVWCRQLNWSFCSLNNKICFYSSFTLLNLLLIEEKEALTSSVLYPSLISAASFKKSVFAEWLVVLGVEQLIPSTGKNP